MSSLWTHLVFVHHSTKRVGRTNIVKIRTPSLIYGLFNQLFALFAAVDLVKTLGRNNLVVGNFYVNYHNKDYNVPLSKIIQLNSLLVPTLEWFPNKEPTLARNVHADVIQNLKNQSRINDLEIGCCFLFPLPGHDRAPHIKNMRFHPIFYQIISPFLASHPQYQVIHYRMENDFTGHFYKQWNYGSLKESRQTLFDRYNDMLKTQFNPEIPTLVVSHYYKDSLQPRDHDLQWENLVHFKLTPQIRAQLYHHLNLPLTAPIREVEAVIDFMLCITPNVVSFMGCGGSTFSGSVCLFHDNKNCSLVHPVK